MTRFVALFVVLALSLGGLTAQKQYSFLQVNNANGLVSNRVSCVFKDSRGFIWIGTKAGLSRFDGPNVVNYKHDSTNPSSILDNYIINIQEDKNGNLLLQTSIGYIIFDIHKEKFYADINKYLGLKSGLYYFQHIYCDPNKELWVKLADQQYYLRLNADKQVLEHRFQKLRPEGPHVLYFKHVANAYYYLFDNGRIECYNDTNYELKFANNFLLGKVEGGSFTPGLLVDRDSDIWFYGNNNGVYHFSAAKQRWQHYGVHEGSIRLSSNIIYEIIQDNKGLIWVATDHGGINIINKTTGQIHKLNHSVGDGKSLADNSITDLYMDDNQIIWASTNKSGVSYYHESIHKFPHYSNLASENSGMSFSDVNCFAEDALGNLWIGTNGAGLVYFNRKTNTYTYHKHRKDDPQSISSNVVVSLFIDSGGELWIGTYAGGVNRFNGTGFKAYQFNTPTARGLSNNNIWSIIEDDELNLWISTNGGGIRIYNRKTDTFLRVPNFGKISLPTQYVAKLLKLANGNIFIGTAYGALVYDAKDQQYKSLPFENAGKPMNFFNKSVNDLFEDSRGLLWMATNEGLIVFDPRTALPKLFNNADGLPEDMITGIEEDELHNMWVSKSTGLSHIRVAPVDSGQGYDFSISHFTEEDGLQANEFNPNACCRTANNELVFGGVNGFNLFRAKDIKRNSVLPKVVFTDFQVYNKSILPGSEVNDMELLERTITSTRKIVIKHSMNVFSIDFTALDFFIPDKIRYKYKLEGFNDNWLMLNNTHPRVTYTNLNAGHYVFKVKAANNDGVWNEQYSELQITVLPPFYATPIAFVVYVLFLILLLVLYGYSVLRKERIKFAIEQERMQIKQNRKMDEMKLRFLTNVSHEFRTPLTLILTPLQKLLDQVERNDQRKLLEVIDRNARNLLGLVNQLLDFRKLELHGLRYNPSFGDIVCFLHGVMENFVDSFSKKQIDFVFEHEIDQFMLDFDKDKLEKVMMNLLSNALKFTPEKGKVTIELAVDENEDLVHVTVSDTGVGIKKADLDKVFLRFFQAESNKKLGLSGSGIGLNLAREMVQLHNGTIRVESEEGQGARFIVTLPVEQLHMPMEELPCEAAETIEDKDDSMPSTAERPVVLLVEDNLDFRTFMRDALQEAFVVHEAANGQLGYDIAHELQPDLIISDVMMPKVDGFELCLLLRKDIRTSHIPIILLTSRTADEDKIKGLENGADDYITKPFNMELLLVRVKNQLKKRSKMQEQFQKSVVISPSEVQITSMDEKLINKAVALVEERIADADFSVEEFSRELGMSRVYLYKKLMAITGKSPVEFIRIIRLKRGAQLLEKSQMNIAEVAYEVGFNSPRYFSKYFKEEFGMLPTAYVKVHAQKRNEG